MAGVYESEPYRILAAETLSYYIMRIQQKHGKHSPIIVMGDFNDTPGSRSMTDYALSSRNQEIVKYSHEESPGLYNLMWPLMGQDYGTFWYSDPLFFDQILVSKGFLVKKRKLEVDLTSVQVIKETKMWETPPPRGKRPIPREFGWAPRDPLGYSDHFPITMKIRET
jgi:endonuclease/exonuclease/phosphatase family metal-dependent hydrolase